MKKRLLSLSLMAISLLMALEIFAQEQISAPVYGNGDFWIFKATESNFEAETTRALNGNYRISYQDGVFTVRSLAEGKEKTRQDLGRLRRMLNIPDEEDQLLRFPIAVGKKWDASHEGDPRRPGAHILRTTGEATVTGIEEVKTPAGTYRAWKIERYDRGFPGGKNSKPRDYTHIFYYSPETRSIVKYHYEQGGGGAGGGQIDFELLKYGSRRSPQ